MSADNRHIKAEHQTFDEFTEGQDMYNIKKEMRETFAGNSSVNSESGIDCPKFIRLRGLPWSATHKEILDFLKGVHVINGSQGIHLITGRWDGKNTGEAYVEVESQQDVEEARKLNKASMGHRYIEVFTTTSKEAREAMRKTGTHGGAYVVKLRGLPFAVTTQQVEEFFSGLEIKPDREGILFVMDRRGRATGEAFVQFETQEDTEQALGRNREKIGHRYIEIFRSSMAELKRAATGNVRPGPYDIRERGSNRGGGGGGGGGFNDFPNGARGNNLRGGWNGHNGANNNLGFNNIPNFTNSGNFGNSFAQNNSNGPNSVGNFTENNPMGFSNNGNFGPGCNKNNGPNNQGHFSNFNANNNGGKMPAKGNANNFSVNNRFNNNNNNGPNNNDNFGNDFGDFNNFGNQRNFMGGNNFPCNNMPNNEFRGNRGPGGNNYGNFGNDGPNQGNFNNGPPPMGGNFGPIGVGRGDCELFTVHMRGLPYSCFENDVFKFFDPIRPVNVRINFNKKGLHSGTADAFFETYEDAQLAMKRHREQMGSRYIELFFDGKTKGGNPMPYGNNAMGNNGGDFSRRI